MIQIEAYIKSNAPGSLYGEWAKKESCWQRQIDANRVCSVSADKWNQIVEWGRISEKLSLHQRGIAADIAKKIRQWRDQALSRLSANEINAGLHILEIVKENAPPLLEEMPDDIISEPTPETLNQLPITIELVQEAVAWDKRHKILSIKYYDMLTEIAQGQKSLNAYNMDLVRSKIKFLISKGFNPNDLRTG